MRDSECDYPSKMHFGRLNNPLCPLACSQRCKASQSFRYTRPPPLMTCGRGRGGYSCALISSSSSSTSLSLACQRPRRSRWESIVFVCFFFLVKAMASSTHSVQEEKQGTCHTRGQTRDNFLYSAARERKSNSSQKLVKEGQEGVVEEKIEEEGLTATLAAPGEEEEEDGGGVKEKNDVEKREAEQLVLAFSSSVRAGPPYTASEKAGGATRRQGERAVADTEDGSNIKCTLQV